MKEAMLFCKGCFKLFYLDAEKLTRVFLPIHEFLRSEILMQGNWKPNIITLYLLEIFNLCSGFYFCYHPNCTTDFLQSFLEETDKVVLQFEVKGPLNHPKINVLNMFVNELIRHVKLFRQERVIVSCLKCCQLFIDDLEIPGRKTRLRIHTLLLDELTPGGPLYPTRRIREAAKETLDILFPAGKFSRSLLSFGFRLLHPIELYRSIHYWFYHPREFALKIVYWFKSWLSYIIMFFYFYIYAFYKMIRRLIGR